MLQANYNPDVLSCLANLSNDEVFTPPNLVNDILDLLPTELWSNPNAKFLDPVSKSGVFLREMAKRLMKGLETKIPDKQERINHIFSQQLYGIAITELTSLLSRRSVYCSKMQWGSTPFVKHLLPSKVIFIMSDCNIFGRMVNASIVVQAKRFMIAKMCLKPTLTILFIQINLKNIQYEV